MRIPNWIVFWTGSFLLLACSTSSTPTATPSPLPPTITPIPAPTQTATQVPDPPTLPIDLSTVGVLTPTVPLVQQTVFGFTYQNADGNRFVPGRGSVGNSQPTDILLAGPPAWVVGAPIDGGGSIWSAILEDGQVQSFMILAGQINPISIMPDTLDPGEPPLLMIAQGFPRLFRALQSEASRLTHAVVLGQDPDNYAYINTAGDLVVLRDGQTTTLAVGALPDSRILQNEEEQLLLLTGATTEYAHGVLGDRIEAGNITLVETNPPGVLHTFSTGDSVIEGLSPIWTDMNGDGEREIIATLSNDVEGAKLVVFDQEGNRLAEGPGIGRGFRWRHQLAVGPFLADGTMVLVDNLTPHIGGVTEFFIWEEDGLRSFTSITGFSTHRLGSRNLDMSVAGDFDGNGIPEILVPTQPGRGLIGLEADTGTVRIGYRLQLGDRLNTNFATVVYEDGRVGLGIGLESGLLRLWLPE